MIQSDIRRHNGGSFGDSFTCNSILQIFWKWRGYTILSWWSAAATRQQTCSSTRRQFSVTGRCCCPVRRSPLVQFLCNCSQINCQYFIQFWDPYSYILQGTKTIFLTFSCLCWHRGLKVLYCPARWFGFRFEMPIQTSPSDNEPVTDLGCGHWTVWIISFERNKKITELDFNYPGFGKKVWKLSEELDLSPKYHFAVYFPSQFIVIRPHDM